MGKIIVLGILIAGGIIVIGALTRLWSKLDEDLDDGSDDDNDFHNYDI